MPRKDTKKKVKKVVKSAVNEDVVKMLVGTGFKETPLPKSMQDKYKGHKATYAVKVTVEGGTQAHIIILSIFEDAYRFAIMDDCGIIKMCSFKPDTPADVLDRYIGRLADVLRI